MLIAFEGPDNTGKSTSANHLSGFGPAIYNADTTNYALAQEAVSEEKSLVQCFDRIDWLTHMAYRLALPDHEWNDARVRTVFAMPDTHLVFKVHNAATVPDTDEEEGYKYGKPRAVNHMYHHLAEMFMTLNETREFSLFKTVSIIEVSSYPEFGMFTQKLTQFSSPVFPWGTREEQLVRSDEHLLEMLRREEQHRL